MFNREFRAVRAVKRRNLCCVGLASASMIAIAGQASAQDVGTRAVANEEGAGAEIVVTAQKRLERLQDVPISISVLSGDTLDRSGFKGATEALSKVPAVSVLNAGQGGGTSIAVRGVAAGEPLFAGSSPIGYYVDGIPFGLVKSAVVPDPSIYDLDRVEVLKGPQGTLYGANSLNGVVRILTKNADLEAFEVKAAAEGSTVKGGGEGYRGDLAVNIPIVEGKLAARLVVGYNNVGGWINKPNEVEANDSESGNIRLKINGRPTDALSIGVSYWRSRNDYGSPGYSNVNDEFPRTLDDSISTDFDSYGLNIGYDFQTFTLTSNTSYLRYANQGALDLGGVQLTTDLRAKIFSQELLLTSNAEGPWLWSLGGFFRDATDDLDQDVLLPDGTSLFLAPLDYTDKSKSVAVFGQLTRKLLNDKFELTAGIRYFRDRVRQIENQAFNSLPRPLIRETDTYEAWTPRFVIAYHPSRSQTLYASYSQGFRSGANQYPNIIFGSPNIPPATPDKLNNYELGAKGALLDGIVNYETAIYYIKWNDIQQVISANTAPPGATPVYSSAVLNSESASGLGFDFSLSARPAMGLNLAVNFSYNGLEFDRDTFSGGVLYFSKGERLNNSPKYTIGGSADYIFDLGGSGYRAKAAAAVNYTSKNERRREAGGLVTRLTGQNVLLADANIGIIAPAGWEASLFVNNAFNNRRTLIQESVSPDELLRTMPRRVGIRFEYRFGGR